MFWSDVHRWLANRWRTVPRSRLAERATPKNQKGWPLDRAILSLGDSDRFTLRDACEGILCFGMIGSGKTSGTVDHFGHALLSAGCGAIVLTTKPDEPEAWVRRARQAGRGADVVLIDPARARFNALRYLLGRRDGAGRGVASNAADLLVLLAKAGKPRSVGSDTEHFFGEQAHRLLLSAMSSLRLADVPIGLEAIAELISTAPTTPWQGSPPENDLFGQVYAEAQRAAVRDGLTDQLNILQRFWGHRWPNMNERTRGDVLATLDSVLHRLGQPPVSNLIDASAEDSFTPDDVCRGKILIFALPETVYQGAGRLVQLAHKVLVQNVVKARTDSDSTRPVAIIADEAQNFVSFADTSFQAVCRSARGITLYATQSVDHVRAAIGREDEAEALMATFGTVLLHANAGRTNQWAEDRIARDWRVMHSANQQFGSHASSNGPSFSYGSSDQLHPQVLASTFTKLATGGPMHQFMVEAIIFKTGRLWLQTGLPIMKVIFSQRSSTRKA